MTYWETYTGTDLVAYISIGDNLGEKLSQLALVRIASFFDY